MPGSFLGSYVRKEKNTHVFIFVLLKCDIIIFIIISLSSFLESQNPAEILILYKMISIKILKNYFSS